MDLGPWSYSFMYCTQQISLERGGIIFGTKSNFNTECCQYFKITPLSQKLHDVVSTILQTCGCYTHCYMVGNVILFYQVATYYDVS